MPDFAMCDDNDCPFRKDCTRHLVSGTRPDELQSWAMFIKHGDGEKPTDCDGWRPKEVKT